MNFSTIGCCGLFCESCDVYQSLHNGTLKSLAQKWGMAAEDLACDGCRSDRRCLQSRECFIRHCVIEKEKDGCGECEEFPCPTLIEFADSEAPHRSLAIENCSFYREVGRFEWYHMQQQKWTCSCGTPFTWYQIRCSRCGKLLDNSLKREAKAPAPEEGPEEGEERAQEE